MYRLFVILPLIALLTACAQAAAEVAEETIEPATATATQPPTATSTPSPTATDQPTHTPIPTETPIPSATPLPDRIVDGHGVEMVLIPAGEFVRGSEEGFPDEVPVNTVYIDAFYIDLTEVTNRQYQDCVEAGVCEPPRRFDCCLEFGIGERPDYYGNPEFDDYPVIHIDWYDARTFCEWRGGRLATEAEWEKASRGTDGRMYPWGNEPAAPHLLNYTWLANEHQGQPLYNTSPVGSYPDGASPYGVLDLAGNVYEWVYDVYAPDYYSYTPYENPTGPEEGSYRVTRGGSFYNQAFRNRSANRNHAWIPASSTHFDGGARCAADVPGLEDE
ncbi:MAG: SUMF1/EgtB/PvdO family nonheme iron enzyme [Chloroflexi bacterium]|nr:SUMF1/EgtB/PvdO family nonheme iron enzyme [Chloroflexota bacterium]